MKKVKLLLILVAVFMPIYSVKALDLLNYMPEEIQTEEGIVFTREDDVYSTAVDNLTSELNLLLDFPGYTYEGNTKLYPVPGTIKSIIRVYPPSETDEACTYTTCNYQVLTFVVNTPDPSSGDSAYLKSLKVVGSDMNYQEGVMSYTVTVPTDSKEVYIEAVPYNDTAMVKGAGVVKLTGLKTEVTVINNNLLLGEQKYTIVIKKSIKGYLLIGLIVLLIIAIITTLIIKNKKSKVSVKGNSEFDGVTKGEIVNTKNVIKDIETKEEVKIEEKQVEEKPLEEKPVEEVKTAVVDTTIEATETPVALNKEENNSDVLINNPIMGEGLAPRTMIVPDQE